MMRHRLVAMIVGCGAWCLTAAAQEMPADVADVPCEEVTIGGDANQRYFLIGAAKGRAAAGDAKGGAAAGDAKGGAAAGDAKGVAPNGEAKGETPKDGYRVLVVLPGGDGSAEFNPFVRRMWKNALSKEWVVVQLVAPKWREDENRIVWPTSKSPDDKAKFTTEEFIESAIGDVKKRCKVNEKQVHVLAWSSGGPAAYAAAMQEKTALRGAFVAMSVFKPDQLPAAANAKGRAFYLLHSPTDFIKMRFPEAAKETLSKAGAKVELKTYEGGHGWHGDVFGNIRGGVEWLAKNSE